MNQPSQIAFESPAQVSQAAAARQRQRPFWILFASLICIGIGQTLIFAVLPPAARDLGLSDVQVGSIFTVSAVLWVVMSPFWGRRSDALGRRPLILLGLGGYVADRTQPHERGPQLALLGAAFALGTIVGPAVVAALLGFGLVAPFYGAGVLALISAATVALWLPDSKPMQRRPQTPPRLSPLDRRVRPFLLVAVVVELSQVIAMLAAGFYAMDVLRMEPTASARSVGIMLTGEAAAMLVAQLILIRLLQPSPRTMMVLGAGVGIVAFVIIVFSRTYLPMLAAMTLLGLGFGFLRPGFMAGSSLAVGVDEQGGVAGLMSATGGMAVIFAPFVGMSLYGLAPQAPYVVSAVLAAAVLLACFLHPQLRRAR